MSDSSVARRRDADGGRSRVTAALRLALAVWLMWTAGQTMLDPPRQAEALGQPTALVLPVAALHFTLGMFLLSGFMSRVAGLVLVGLGTWEMLNIGRDPLQPVMVLVGLYLVLRGGGAWAMDVYVQAMQDRVREREERERAASEATAAATPPAGGVSAP